MLQHMENCNHTAALMSSAKLILQELPGNSPTTVKYDTQSKKNLEQQTLKQLERFYNNNDIFFDYRKIFININDLLIFFKKIRYRKTSPVQNQRIKREEEKEEEQQQQQIDNRNAWIPHPKIPGGLFDNVINMNGIVYYYTMAPNTYN